MWELCRGAGRLIRIECAKGPQPCGFGIGRVEVDESSVAWTGDVPENNYL